VETSSVAEIPILKFTMMPRSIKRKADVHSRDEIKPRRSKRINNLNFKELQDEVACSNENTPVVDQNVQTIEKTTSHASLRDAEAHTAVSDITELDTQRIGDEQRAIEGLRRRKQIIREKQRAREFRRFQEKVKRLEKIRKREDDRQDRQFAILATMSSNGGEVDIAIIFGLQIQADKKSREQEYKALYLEELAEIEASKLDEVEDLSLEEELYEAEGEVEEIEEEEVVEEEVEDNHGRYRGDDNCVDEYQKHSRERSEEGSDIHGIAQNDGNTENLLEECSPNEDDIGRCEMVTSEDKSNFDSDAADAIDDSYLYSDVSAMCSDIKDSNEDKNEDKKDDRKNKINIDVCSNKKGNTKGKINNNKYDDTNDDTTSDKNVVTSRTGKKMDVSTDISTNSGTNIRTNIRTSFSGMMTRSGRIVTTEKHEKIHSKSYLNKITRAAEHSEKPSVESAEGFHREHSFRIIPRSASTTDVGCDNDYYHYSNNNSESQRSRSKESGVMDSGENGGGENCGGWVDVRSENGEERGKGVNENGRENRGESDCEDEKEEEEEEEEEVEDLKKEIGSDNIRLPDRNCNECSNSFVKNKMGYCHFARKELDAANRIRMGYVDEADEEARREAKEEEEEEEEEEEDEAMDREVKEREEMKRQEMKKYETKEDGVVIDSDNNSDKNYMGSDDSRWSVSESESESESGCESESDEEEKFHSQAYITPPKMFNIHPKVHSF
jgi:hypothetical protein